MDWLAMCEPEHMDAIEWFGSHYTGHAGRAQLVLGDQEERRSIQPAPLQFREDIRYIEVPPLRNPR